MRDGVGRAAQGADHPHVAVARVVQSQLETQPEPVAHRQRHFQPARRGNDHVDPVGKAHVDQFGYPGQQRITGVELIGVIAAEAIEIVDDQEHLTEPVVGGRAISTPVTEYFPLLPGQQQLLELAEGAADAFGFQR
ncbi:Uncharacterised protein [Mycobacterium tuberculosis]|uniref:Uncharacterized protein n=1 Tax=Mycobacterium tuberculosis TaxID=1773 RepID=A0A655FWC6_MYCTX|nr:Uncharacterised protein [Mycobacterium tuberculosis]CFS07576.1 Uncharacterised protein [Mycobacterium tuberculosis]CFS09945.1 Uncharacterised protein [Mycobacterium tuberculosis]CNW36565.1 Uncharacterised protein [Mycobacterium tuberculosis]COU62142.1 Uncharacterised protein [Mycobacterium tuberculosis]